MNRKQRRISQSQAKGKMGRLSQEEWLADARMLHNAGNLKEAETIYRKLLGINSANAEILNLLGTLHAQRGELQESLRLLEQAVAVNPHHVKAHITRGTVLYLLRRLGEAVASYDRATALDPDHHADAYNGRGNALDDLGRHEEALASFDKAITINPRYAEAYNNRGIVLNRLERQDEALAHFDKAIAINPSYAAAYTHRGNILNSQKDYRHALESYDKAIAINPKYAEAYSNRGIVLNSLKRYHEALASFDRAIAISPHYAEAYSSRGMVLNRLNRYDEALVSFDKAIALNPNYAEAYSNRGIVLNGLKRYEEARASFDKAIALNPHYAEAYFDKSLLELVLGKYEAGWKLYEWRWQGKKDIGVTLRKFEKPLWLGTESLEGKTLLLYAEQGLGDTIQFCRYIPLLEAMGIKVVLEAQPALISVISTVSDAARFIAQGEPVPEFDFQCPLMSLPLALGTNLDTIPASIPYLYTSPDKHKAWQDRLGHKTRPRIGLVWSGGTIHVNDYNRSIALSLVTPLLRYDFDFYALQKEIKPDDEAALAQHTIISRADELKDFSDTAAFLSEMDLVISVDTSVAHLAGALGKPVWILVSFRPDFRWLTEREDSPWYPTARLFRQPRPGDWESVMAGVQTALRMHFNSDIR